MLARRALRRVVGVFHVDILRVIIKQSSWPEVLIVSLLEVVVRIIVVVAVEKIAALLRLCRCCRSGSGGSQRFSG